MLKVEGLSIKYGGIEAVRNISFRVREKQIVALIGNNGAGKSSTLKAISGLQSCDGGRILFEGAEITGRKPHEIAKGIGIIHIPEGRHVFAGLTVKENLLLSAYSRTVSKKAFRGELDKVFDQFPRLKERRNQTAGTLSGGEQQMLAIARGVLQAPKLLILDEPSMGLAPIIVDEVFEIIRGINQEGVTVLVVEQNAQVALSSAHYGYVMDVGELILDGEAKDLLNNPTVKKIYLGEEA
ncbi:MAG: ABC transporter ATP-binding protein [Lachnospiraceae bacterium]